jgi:two-component system response regulator FixJ
MANDHDLQTGFLIYVVDDDEAFRESLAALLDSEGFDVADFPGGAPFLAALDHRLPFCALVDINMPKLDGIAVLSLLRESGFDFPVIMMSGKAELQMAIRALREGASDFIEKPFDVDELRAAILRLKGKTPLAKDDEPALDDFRSNLQRLTEREREVLEAVVAGHTAKAIAFELGISPRTVHAHRLRIGEKLGVSRLPNLVRLSLRAGVHKRQDLNH